MFYIFALLIGAVAGLRVAVAPAAIGWGSLLGWLPLENTWASFMGHWIVVGLLTLAVLAEFLNEQRPGAGGVRPAGAVRVISGGFCGAILGTIIDAAVGGAVAGVIGAVIGTFAGYGVRNTVTGQVSMQGVALAEEVVAIAGGLIIVSLAT